MDCLPQIHTIAIHAEAGFRSAVPGIGVLCREREYLTGAGVYSNSIGKPSAYAIAGWQRKVGDDLRVGFVVGAASGYRPHAIAVGALMVSYNNLHFTVIPKIKGKGATPWTVGVSFTLP